MFKKYFLHCLIFCELLIIGLFFSSFVVAMNTSTSRRTRISATSTLTKSNHIRRASHVNLIQTLPLALLFIWNMLITSASTKASPFCVACSLAYWIERYRTLYMFIFVNNVNLDRTKARPFFRKGFVTLEQPSLLNWKLSHLKHNFSSFFWFCHL